MSSPSVDEVQNKEAWLTALGIALLTLVIMLPSLALVPGRDSGLFLYVGQGILQGEVPYRDIWDHKPPLIFFTYALGLLISTGSLWGPWLIEFCSVALAAWLLWRVLRPIQGRAIALMVTVLFLLTLVDLLRRGGCTESFTLPLQMAVPWIILAWRRAPGLRRWPILLGALAAAAFLYRQNHIMIFVAGFLVGAFTPGTWRGFKYLLQSFLWCCSGAIAFMVPFALYFILHGAWGQMWDAAFVYNTLYTQVSITEQLGAVGYGIERVPWSYGALLIWVIVTLRWVWKRTWPVGDRGTLLLLAWIVVPLEFYATSVSGRHFSHYFILWLPSLSLLLAELFASARGASGSLTQSPWLPRILTTLLFVAAVLVARLDTLEWRYRSMGDETVDGELRRSAQYLENNTSENQRSLIWGADPVILVLAERRSVSRFVYQYPLITRGYHQQEMTDEFVEALRLDPPTVIIDTGHLFFPRLDQESREAVELPDRVEARAYGPLAPEISVFFDQVDRDYQKTESFGNFEVFVPRY